MHGILIELLPEEWGTKLHDMSIRPYSQWIEESASGSGIWHIRVLDDTLGSVIMNVLQKQNSVFCRHTNEHLSYDITETRTCSITDYALPFLETQIPEWLQFHFMTPTTHKSQGQYVLFPSVDLITQSIHRKLASVDDSFVLADSNIAEKIAQHSRIIQYQLQSRSFSLEGTRVTGYTGSVEIKLSGEPLQMQLSAMLFSFAEWCGAGIKTALGMGGCKVIPITKEQEA